MSSAQRRQAPGVIDQLFEQPHRFQFFQAVRLLERWLPGEVRAGDGAGLPPEIRFCNSASLSFPASEIESLQLLHDEADDPDDANMPPLRRIELTPAFIGLLGVNGALPLVYTEQFAQRELHHRDSAARRFLDVFTHRLTSLFYAAWKKHRLHIQYEADRKNRFLPMVLSLAGLGLSPLRDRLEPQRGGVADETVAFFAGALQQRVLSASQLANMLSRYLHVPVRVEQFSGHWYVLPAHAKTALGNSNGLLGRNALCGERVWQRDLRVRLHVGPLSTERFRRLLPGAPGAVALRKLVTLLTGPSLEYEVNLIVQAQAVQGTRLESARPSTVSRLGWDTYLLTCPQATDRSDVRYDIHAEPAA